MLAAVLWFGRGCAVAPTAFAPAPTYCAVYSAYYLASPITMYVNCNGYPFGLGWGWGWANFGHQQPRRHPATNGRATDAEPDGQPPCGAVAAASANLEVCVMKGQARAMPATFLPNGYLENGASALPRTRASHSSSHRGQATSVQRSAPSLARTCTAELSTCTTSARSSTATPPSTASSKTWTASPVSEPMTRALPRAPGSWVIMSRALEARGPADGTVGRRRPLMSVRPLSSPCHRRFGVTASDHRPAVILGVRVRRRARGSAKNVPAATSRRSGRQAGCFPHASPSGRSSATLVPLGPP
jgi:hypothetical protein